MRLFKEILWISVVIVLVSACEKTVEQEMPPPFMESFADIEECLSFASMKGNQPNQDQSCISYSYDGDSTLSIIHYNSGFNCCPEAILTSFEIRNDTIFITEDDSLSLCRCNCLFNVEMTIHNLSPGEYVLKIYEPLVGPKEKPFVISLDLENQPNDKVCIKREFYPWLEL